MTGDLDWFDGITDDFNSIIDNDLGLTVSYTPVTTTQYGNSTTRANGTAANRSIFLYLAGQSYAMLPEGFFKDSDAVALVKGNESWVRDSIVTYANNEYIVKNVTQFHLPGANTCFYKRVDLVVK